MTMLAFLFVVAFVVVSVVWAASRPDEPGHRRVSPTRAALVVVGWVVVSALPTLAGLVAPDGPVPPQALMAAVLLVSVWFAMSGVGGRIATNVPLHLIVGFQGFRLPLELVLHQWAGTGVAPPQMTWTGQNPDIVSGALAILFIPIVRRVRASAWVPTVVGSLLLLNVLRVVATSLPGPLMRFDDPITLPTRFPHVWIATVCVAGAVAGHLIAFRALVRPARKR